MLNQFSRTQLLLGQDGMERLYNARIAVFGIGGVAATRWRRWCAAASARWTSSTTTGCA